MNKRKIFTICASIGFALVICKLCVGTCDADISTIQHALANLEQLKPIESMNTVSFFYLCIAVAPVAFAISCGCFGVICLALWKFAKTSCTIRQILRKKEKMKNSVI